MRQRPRAHQTAIDDSAIDSHDYDYADAFEIELPLTDVRSPEQMFRTAIAQEPSVMRLIPFVHRHVLRFHLGPAVSPDHLFGWRIVTSAPDIIRLEAEGPLLRGILIGRRGSGSTAVLMTYVFYVQPARARVIWALVGPLHRMVAPYLLERAVAAVHQAKSMP